MADNAAAIGRVDEAQQQDPDHHGRGQEAVQIGAIANLRTDDYLLYAHRGVAYLIAKGLSLTKLFGDFVGTTVGTTGGLGAGIVHIAAPGAGRGAW